MNLQSEVDKLNCNQAEHALASIGGKGSAQYYCIFNFIQHVKRLQTSSNVPVLFKKKSNE